MAIDLDLTETVNKFSTPLAKCVGDTLGAIWYLTFGRFDRIAEKSNLKWLDSLEKFKADLESKTSAIPQENICEPRLSIVGPAMEASKYYFDEATLRDMFTNLIANSMNSDFKPYIQNSFIEVIKQMSPLDALLLQDFALYPDGDMPILRIVNINSSDASPEDADLFCAELTCARCTIQRHYYSNSDIPSLSPENISIVFDNLHRLGLISIPENTYVTDIDQYSKYRSDSYIEELVSEYATHSSQLIRFLYGAASLTDYGKHFCKVCL